jgi:pyruvate formate lyase activating enzyme
VPGRPGICGVRWNDAGTLRTGIHGRLVSANVDPIEKKPLSHYHPGSQSLSVATVGCNMRCLFCQNASISQWPFDPAQSPPGNQVEAAELVETAVRTGSRSISFTYTEPTLGLEYAAEVGAIAAKREIGSVFVTNGFLSSESAAAAATFLEAANVDLKSMRERTYRRTSKARLAPVLQTLEDWVAAGIWIEVTTLVVPGLNDEPAELRDIARFIAGLGADVPWHISAFHPTYLMTDRPRTPVSTLRRAHEIGREEGVNHVYVGNVWGAAGESTFCAGCERRLIHRHGYTLLDVDLDGDRCPGCGEVLAGVGIGE